MSTNDDEPISAEVVPTGGDPDGIADLLGGATGGGLLASIVFEAIGPGLSQIAVAGVGMNAAGQQVPLQLVPATITVK